MIENLVKKDLEQIFLSSCVHSENFHEVSEIVKKNHFYDEEHKIIWETIKEIDNRGSEISPALVSIELMKKETDCLSSFKLVMAQTPMPSLNILAVEIIEWFNKRELYRLSLQIQEQLQQKAPSAYIAKEIDDAVMNLDVGVGTKAKSSREWRIYYGKTPDLPLYATGVSFIDDALGGGAEGGQLILVMGDPEAGKTIMTTQILRNISNGFPTLFFCFEFTVRQFLKINTKRKTEFNEDNLFIINEGYSLSDVEREIKIWSKKGVRFIVIDSQMRVDNSENKGTVEQMESEKFNKLAKLCHSLEVIILFIAQQGKEDTKGGTHSPMGTKKGAHEANQIWYIHKKKPKFDEAGNDENKEVREFEISKNKQNGRHFRTEVKLNPVLLEFTRKYKDREKPKETMFTNDGKGGKIKVEVMETENTNVELPTLL